MTPALGRPTGHFLPCSPVPNGLQMGGQEPLLYANASGLTLVVKGTGAASV